jgi:hypothetical protein
MQSRFSKSTTGGSDVPDFYHGNIPIIETDLAPTDLSHPKHARFGLVPRDYSIYPQTMFAQPDQMQVIPESEWDARYDEQEATQSSLEHIYLSGPNGDPAFVNLDQNGDGHCWCYSTGHSVMLDRLRRGLPLIRVNPHAIAAILRQLDGGWCGLSAKFVREHGIPEEGTGPGQWPKWSNKASNETPAVDAAMALRKIEEDWVDLTKQEYDQNLTRAQVATCGFSNIPTPSDFNWWSHSVCQVRWVRIEKGSWGPLILNSWLNWGRHGLGVLRGRQATCDGAVATRLTSASAT